MNFPQAGAGNGTAERGSLKNLEKLNSTKMMKKNFIYSLCILLCGTLFLSSCEDMLEVDSDRVEYDMSPLTLNDTVYSVLGILKNIQAVADRQVLLGELRGDLMVVNEGSAVTDIQKIARFDFGGDNKYLAAKDYYSIINNCNIYLARVDTSLTRDNVKPMLREYVAVKSARAWTYMQLAMNYGKVPYFTEPILTHSLSQEIFNRPALGIEEIADKLIEDLRPYANPTQYPMPSYSGLYYATELYFMPIRQLLGDLYLWKKDYRNAIDCYYNLIRDKKYAVDGVGNRAFWANDEGTSEFPLGDYMPLASSVKKENTLAVVTFSSSSEYGSVSDLHNIFGGDWTVTGSHQVAAAPGLYGLSKRQAYCYYNDRNSSNPYVVYNPQREKTGDVRIYQNVQDNLMNDETGIKYNGFITKYSGGAILMNGLTTLRLGRPVQTYLRLAEALAGLAAEESTEITVGGAESGTIESSSWEGAEAMAMHILKYGLGVKEGKDVALKHNGKFEIKKRLNDTPDTTYVMVEKLDENGEVIMIGAVDEEGNPIMEPVLDEEGNPVMIAAVDAEGNPIMEPVLDEEGNPVIGEDGNPVMQQKMVAKEQQKMVAELEEQMVINFVADYDVISLDFSETEFKNNMGIHSFGSGNADRDVYYTIDNDSVIAAYFDIVDEAEVIFELDEEGNPVVGEDGNPVVKGVDYGITHAMKIEYLRNLILDECALETSFEGYRFTDLIRFAKAMGNNDVLAKRVAARAFENKVNMYYDTEGAYGSDGSLLKFEWDESLYNTLSDESNWYLPLK